MEYIVVKCVSTEQIKTGSGQPTTVSSVSGLYGGIGAGHLIERDVK